MNTVHGGTPAGSARPGSRVTDRISCGVPTEPATIASCAATKSAAKRRLKPTCSGTPASRAAAIARSASGRVIDIGFSQKIALPAAAAATTSSQCAVEEAAITTASMSSASKRSSGASTPRAPSAEPSASATPGRGSATATSEAPGTRRAMISACDVPMRPAPMRPTGMMRGSAMSCPSGEWVQGRRAGTCSGGTWTLAPGSALSRAASSTASVRTASRAGTG